MTTRLPKNILNWDFLEVKFPDVLGLSLEIEYPVDNVIGCRIPN
jgi:hypothetical protein